MQDHQVIIHHRPLCALDQGIMSRHVAQAQEHVSPPLERKVTAQMIGASVKHPNAVGMGACNMCMQSATVSRTSKTQLPQWP